MLELLKGFNFKSEIVYGGVDGLITTFAIIAGSVGANFSNKVIIVLGIASIIVDGFSMGISSFLAEKIKDQRKHPLIVGISTFLAFIFIGCLPLIPFIFEINYAFIISTIILLIILFILGYLKGDIKNAAETVLVGGIGVFISYYVASFIKKFV